MPKITYNYFKDDLYTPIYSNGAIGEVTSKGEIMINFYIEFSQIPNTQVYEIEGVDIKSEVVKERMPEFSKGNPVINRVINTGVIMNKDTATEFYKWLGSQLELLKTM